MRPFMLLIPGFFVLAFGACASREQAQSALTQQANIFERSPLLPPIVYVIETQALPGKFVEHEIAMNEVELAHFRNAWLQIKPHLLAQVRVDSLRGVSLWAREEMKSFSLPEDWLEKIPLWPMASLGNEQLVRFGQYKEEGLPLPSHHPLVFRRLVLFADFDRSTQRIVQVIVSISGWVEE